MRAAFRIARTYALLGVVLWLLAHVDSLLDAGGIWGAVSFTGATAFYVLILPGLKTFGLLVPYSVNEAIAVSLMREAISLLATAVFIFVVALAFIKAFAHGRKPAQA